MKKIIAVMAIVLVIGAFVAFQNKEKFAGLINSNESSETSSLNSPTTSSVPNTNGSYKDGSYTGVVGSASQYGDIQVKVIISGGKITDIQYLQFPSGGGHTAEVTAMAKPALKQEAITAQSASINVVSGATQDTEGFIQSLQSALDQAKS